MWSTRPSVSHVLLVASFFSLGYSTATQCHHDNCYRAMFPTASPTQLSSATAFCRTYTTAINTNTAITQFPTRATSACGSSPPKYSSICSCGVPPAPKCTSDTATNLIKNGDFECGLAPWTTYVLDARTTYKLSSPGYSSNTTFRFDIGPGTSTSDASARLIQTTGPLVAGATYTVTFATNIFDGNAGFWGVMVNNQPYRTVDARDQAGPGVWNVNSFDFVSQGGSAEVKFEVITSEPGAIFQVDRVTLVKE